MLFARHTVAPAPTIFLTAQIAASVLGARRPTVMRTARRTMVTAAPTTRFHRGAIRSRCRDQFVATRWALLLPTVQLIPLPLRQRQRQSLWLIMCLLILLPPKLQLKCLIEGASSPTRIFDLLGLWRAFTRPTSSDMCNGLGRRAGGFKSFVFYRLCHMLARVAGGPACSYVGVLRQHCWLSLACSSRL